ncbi:MAG: hypothetical protein ACOYOB_21000 [Myxococcota bacterium]
MRVTSCTISAVELEALSFDRNGRSTATFGLYTEGQRAGETALTGVLDDDGVAKAFADLKNALETAAAKVLGGATADAEREVPKALIKVI